MKGLTQDELAKEWISRFLDDSDVFIPCLRDPAKVQINVRAMAAVNALASSKNIPAQILMEFANKGMMTMPEIQADLTSKVPVITELFDKWDSSCLANFQLATIGIAIGHACQRQVVTDGAPLETFLS
jgi:hypothetical protein